MNQDQNGRYPETGLKFLCENCGEEIIVLHLKVGDEAKCPHCGIYAIVPDDAEIFEGIKEILAERRKRAFAPIPKKPLTLAEKIKNKYRKIEIWAGFFVSFLCALLLERYMDNDVLRYLMSILAGSMVTITIATLRKEEEDSTPRSELDKTIVDKQEM